MTGLTETEARRRLAERGPRRPPQTSRSYASIVRANLFNLPNAVLVFFGVATVALGELADALFLGVVVANTVIGSAQEIRAKRALDRLAALVRPHALVIRDGSPRALHADEVVVGDLVGTPARRPGRRGRDGARERRAATRRVDSDRRVAAGRARAGRARALGRVRRRGSRALRGHGRRPRELRGASRRGSARLPPSALAVPGRPRPARGRARPARRPPRHRALAHARGCARRRSTTRCRPSSRPRSTSCPRG